ncbi:MAG: hypothetical protein UU21_C0021G0013 [Candidatus Levybacteria bacterium GW2011_GWA2_40_8]|nr:MAG: hypothetical protein UU21_C0021G0013 [Candidatus Levybacteria bacterium GW2011_GWA2_40_8]
MYSKAFLAAVNDLKKEKRKKAKQRLIAKLITVVLLFSGFGIGLSSYLSLPFIESYFAKKTAPVSIALTQDSKEDKGEVIATSSSQTIEGQDTLSCPADYNFFEGDFFSICYPNRFKQIYQKDEPAKDDFEEVIFSSSEEELSVSFDSQRNWKLHLCNVSKEAAVDGFKGIRATLKMEDTGGCGKIKGFTTKIDYKDRPLYLSIIKLNGSYENDGEITLIEKSLRLK